MKNQNQHTVILTTEELKMIRFALEQANATFRKRELFATTDTTARSWAKKSDKAFTLGEKIKTVSSVHLNAGVRNL